MTHGRRVVTPQLLVQLLVLVMAAPYAAAAPYTWTTSGTGSVRTDGAGTWNTSALNWTTTGTGSAVAWPNLTTDVAVFGAGSGTAGTVTVSTVSTNGITFNQPGSGSYLLSGGTITLGGSSPTITTAAGVSAQIASSLAGSAGFATSGGGTLTLSGSSAVSGATTFALGEVVLANGAALQNLSGLTVGSQLGAATLRVQSGAALTLTSGSANIIGSETRTLGTVIQEGGVVSIGGSQGSLVLSTNGGATTYSGSAAYVLQGGTLALTDTTNGFISVGRNATATFTQSGGVVTVARTSDATTIGDYATGSYAVSGGSFTAASTSANAVLGNRGGAGTLTVSGSGSFGIGGSIFLAVNANNLASAKGSATVNLQGGTLAVNGMTLGRAGTTGANGPGTATFNFSGGTLRPYSANTSIGSATAANNFVIDVSGTGATLSGIDLASSTARRLDVYATLQGGGDITVAGGTVSLSAANTYAGATTIAGTNTTLALAANGSFASSGTITVGNAGSSGAILDLTAKSGTFSFGAGQRVQGIGTISIGAGKTVSSAGIWAPGNSIGSNTVTGNLALTGTSQFELGTPGTSTSASGTSDFTAVSGTLALGGNLALIDNANAGGLGSYGAGTYRLFTYGAVSGSYASITAANATTRGGIVLAGSGTSAGQGLFLNVYNLASATSGQTVNLGNTRAGTALTGSVTLANLAPLNGTFTETLSTGSFSATSSGFTTSGSASNIAGGGSGSGNLLVGLGTGLTAGAQSGTTTLALFSNAVNSSSLAQQSIGSQTITITGGVYDYAQAKFSGAMLDFGVVHLGASVAGQNVAFGNQTVTNANYQDSLDVSATTGNARVTATGFTSLAASSGGATTNNLAVSVSTATAGSLASTLSLTLTSNANSVAGLSNGTAVTVGGGSITTTGGVFSGTASWNGNGGGSWGTGTSANWTSAESVSAAPGTFVGYTTTDSATFGTALTGGTASILLNGATPSLASIAFANTAGRYVIDQGSGGSLTLAAASGKPTVSVVAGVVNEIKTAILGANGLQKTGLGTLVLSGSNTYSGGTDITAGTLAVNGSLGGAVNVASGGVLGGSGVLNGLVTVAAGGILASGNSPGTLTLTSGLSLADAAILNYELNATNFTAGGGINDLVAVTGDLTLDGILNAAAIGGGDFSEVATGSFWTLVTYSGTFTNNGLTLGALPSLGGDGRHYAIDTSTIGVVNLVVVPEPAAVALAGVGIGLAGWAAARRRRWTS